MTRSRGLGRIAFAALCLSLLSSSPLLAQRSDRAVISGVVTDPQGAALPGAAVTVKNEATGVEIVLQTNNAGAYTTAPLVLGPLFRDGQPHRFQESRRPRGSCSEPET